MSNVLAADMRRLLRSKSFYIITIAIPLYLILSFVLLNFAMDLMGAESPTYSDLLLMDFEKKYSTLVIAAITTLFAGFELRNGVIRNKIVGGCPRVSCFLSSVMISLFSVTVMQLVAYVFSFIFGKIFGEAYIDNVETLKNCVLWLCASYAITVFFVMIVYIFGDTIASYGAAGVLAIAFFFLVLKVNDKLFPVDGIVKVTGTKLKVLEAISKYFAFSYLSMPKIYNIRFYVIGCLIMLIPSLLIGCLVFSRRELK